MYEKYKYQNTQNKFSVIFVIEIIDWCEDFEYNK